MSTTRGEPQFFGPAGRPRAGWIHRTGIRRTGPAADGLVICNPFGYEAICAHRSLRHLAEGAAAAGIPAIRHDYDGTGDSAGGDRDPDRVGAWVASVLDACLTLRRVCGVERFWLVGVRLGTMIATLAALAATDAGELDIAGLIAIAPVVSGRGFLREARARQMTLGLGPPPPAASGATAVEEGGQEALGFAITAETKTALSKLDLATLPRPPAPRVLVLDRDDLPAADKWGAHLRSQGAAAEVHRVPGFVEMMLDPHKAVVPEAMLQTAIQWIKDQAPRSVDASSPPVDASSPLVDASSPPGAASSPPVEGARPVGPSPPPVEGPPPTGHLVASEAWGAARMGDVTERPVHVDAAGRLFGVLSTPAVAPPSRRAVLLLNAGAIHHVGPNRLYVEFARRWAAAGDHVLRFDIAGIGDSAPHPGHDENIVYSTRAVDDVRAAVDWLRRLPGVADVRVVGLCAGAYHGFKAAVAGAPVDGVVAINPLTFFWTADQSLDFPAHRVTGEAARYRGAALDLAKWKKIARGEVDLRRVAETMTRHLTSKAVNRARDVSRRVGLPWKGDLGAELAAVAARHVELRFVFATGEPGLPMLCDQGGSVVPRLRHHRQLVIDSIDGPDHTFTPMWSHAPLADLLTHALAGARDPDRR